MTEHLSHFPERRIVVDSDTASLIAAMSVQPRLHQLEPHDGRLAHGEIQGTPTPVDGVVDTFHTVGTGPTGLLGFRVFRPADAQGDLPAVMYVHGGRWLFGNTDTHAWLTQQIARETGAAVFVPEHSRAPEAHYPTAVEECRALLSVMSHPAGRWGIDIDRIAVAGDCSGATLATVVAQFASSNLRAQALLYPLTDALRSSPSHRTPETNTGVLDSGDLKSSWESYTDVDINGFDAAVSPLYADDEVLRNLPDTLVVSADADPARDEASLYASRLREVGVSVTAVRYLGTVHDFVSMAALRNTPSSSAALSQACAFLRDRLHP